MSRFTPTTIVAIVAAALSVAVAFGAPITHDQTDAILAVGLSVSTILLAHGLSGALSQLSPQTVTGLVTAIVGLLLAFGLPITDAQQQAVGGFAALLSLVLLGHGVVHTAKGYLPVGSTHARKLKAVTIGGLAQPIAGYMLSAAKHDPDMLPDIEVHVGPVTDKGDAGPPKDFDADKATLRAASTITQHGDVAGLSAEHAVQARKIVIEYCLKFLTQPGRVHYTQGSDRWMGITVRRTLKTLFPFSGDCSSTATFILWRGLNDVHRGIRDLVNGEGWKAGFTGTIARHGRTVTSDFQVGDLVLYGPAPDYEHVTVYVGGGFVFSHGGEGGPYKLPIDYRTDRALVKRFM